jgi:hypothetical protein
MVKGTIYLETETIQRSDESKNSLTELQKELDTSTIVVAGFLLFIDT